MKLIWELLYPRHCFVCDSVLLPAGSTGQGPSPVALCDACLHKIQYVRAPRCPKCGKGMENGQQELCFDCSKRRHYFEAGRALYVYGSMAASLYRFKYKGRQEYAGAYAEEVALYLRDAIQVWKPDALVPVPLHRKRQNRRGYNQAGLLAAELSQRLGIPVYDKLVVRCRNTVPQKALNPMQRQNNLKKAFKITQDVVKLDTIIIIDDIYTTGSTIDAVAQVLLEAGATKIYFITLAMGAGL